MPLKITLLELLPYLAEANVLRMPSTSLPLCDGCLYDVTDGDKLSMGQPLSRNPGTVAT